MNNQSNKKHSTEYFLTSNGMNKKIVASLISAALLASPAMILAFDPGPVPSMTQNISIGGLIDIIFTILWPIAVAFFVIMFVLAGFQFATAQGDPEKVRVARQSVIWGVVGVVVALVAFSVVFIVRNTVGV